MPSEFTINVKFEVRKSPRSVIMETKFGRITLEPFTPVMWANVAGDEYPLRVLTPELKDEELQ